jgi:hypothetical protein
MDDEMKERPKVGDRVEFRCRSVRIGTVVAVAETDAHFLIETPFTGRMERKPYELKRVISTRPLSIPVTVPVPVLPVRDMARVARALVTFKR